MKLVTFTKKDGGERIGALIGGESQVLDLRAAGELSGAADNPALASMLAFIEAGGRTRPSSRAAISRSGPRCLSRRRSATASASRRT